MTTQSLLETYARHDAEQTQQLTVNRIAASRAQTAGALERIQEGLSELQLAYGNIEYQIDTFFGPSVPRRITLRLVPTKFGNPGSVKGSVVVAGAKFGVHQGICPYQSYTCLTGLKKPAEGMSDHLIGELDVATEYKRQMRWYNLARFWRHPRT